MAGARDAGPDGLKLKALDPADLAVFAACLQNAVTRPVDMTYLRRQRRFAVVFERYCWEAVDPAILERVDAALAAGNLAAAAGGLPERHVPCGVHFDGVLAVKMRGLDPERPEAVLHLLTITCETEPQGAAVLHLLFDDGAMIRLNMECIDARLMDLPAAGGEEKTSDADEQ
jgi:hypothetical protein